MFPIRDTVPHRHLPFATWGLIAVNVFVFFRELALSPHAVEQMMYLFGLVPARFLHPDWAAQVGYPHTYLPFVTTMFLHGGWLHIIGNMWVLAIFGDNVEDRMGPIRYLLFYFLCGIAAGTVHVLTNPTSTVPAVGASGAIAGVMGAYFALYPKARILAMFPIVFWPIFFEVPAYLYLGFWFVMQFFSGVLAIQTPRAVGGIAFWAHVGGFVTGLATFWIFLRREPVKLAVDERPS
jgi:membrane associated rhomboid family serine protease